MTENLHIAFVAASRSQVEAFHDAGMAAGFSSNGAPDYRERYAPDYFAAYVLDPDGTNVEAVWRDPERRRR